MHPHPDAYDTRRRKRFITPAPALLLHTEPPQQHTNCAGASYIHLLHLARAHSACALHTQSPTLHDAWTHRLQQDNVLSVDRAHLTDGVSLLHTTFGAVSYAEAPTGDGPSQVTHNIALARSRKVEILFLVELVDKHFN